MAEIKWNEDQTAAIEKRGRNILVSAAAGSGKTAVLVERVMRMITDTEDPADISSMLIMTFTKAAAAQMKDKIYKGIRDALKKDPDNEHLHRQLHAVHSARICTIDSLCMDIVRENFHLVDIDPGFKIIDESESLIIQNEVLKDLLEEQYQYPTEGFSQFVDSYIDKSDSKIEQIILTMYRFAQSHPEPEKWIRQSSAPYIKAATGSPDLEDGEDRWLHAMKKFVECEIEGINDMARCGLRLCNMDHGPYPHAPVYEEILALTDKLMKPDTICNVWRDYICGYMSSCSKAAKITAKHDVDESIKAAEDELRKALKARIKKLKEKYFEITLDDAYDEMGRCSIVAKTIEELTIEFTKRFKAAKYEKNQADFNDVAHLALKILLRYGEDGSILKDEEDRVLYSETADEMARELKEIIVDEYQDTNMLQELIISALSAERFSRPDVFMVGDIKQSIYGFRMACPKNFADKYNSYARENEINARILLNRNYRSRPQVLNFANDIFTRTMIPEVGDIDYRDGHGLVYGEQYPNAGEGTEFDPEIVIIEEKGDDGKKTEGYVITKRIEELVDKGRVQGEDGQGMRPVRYSDIAILTRSSDNPELEQALDERKIPVIKASNKGFFEAFEVRLIINLLKIIDNPLQDIPFTAVLTSSLVGMDSVDLAHIKVNYKKQPFSMYRACLEFDDERLKLFMSRLADYRKAAEYMDCEHLMEYVLQDSGLENMLTAMPGGENRKANMEMLTAKAAAFAQNTNSGLFSFLRYIKQMQDADIDFGQAQMVGSQANAVKMMTIHKSKGLEFPIVFLARAGKKYNGSDFRGSLILDRELGMGIEARDPENRTMKSTLIMEILKEARKRSDFAEELRLLYVAVTRAKEKLIITGSKDNLSGSVKKWAMECLFGGETLSAGSLLEADSYMDVIGKALIRHPGSKALWNVNDIAEKDVHVLPDMTSKFSLNIMKMTDAEEEHVDETIRSMRLEEQIEELIDRCSMDKCTDSEIGRQIEFKYPYWYSTSKVIKVTASQLERHDEEKNRNYRKYVPSDESEEGLQVLYGADRGSAYHRVFELIRYENIPAGAPGKSELESCVQIMMKEHLGTGMIDEDVYNTVDTDKIVEFLLSDLGKRMKNAYDRGQLIREQQFVMGYTDEDGDERLRQGIIDAFFEEDGALVLVDYKTDRNKNAEQFIYTYEPQIQAYVEALEAATGMKVKEKILYAVETGECISV